MVDQTASRVTEDMVTRASMVLWTEVDPVYQADARDFTDADVAAGKLREADDADVAANRAIVRHVLQAAFPRCPHPPAADGRAAQPAGSLLTSPARQHRLQHLLPGTQQRHPRDQGRMARTRS
jgi:hypothetical protein